MNRLAWLVVAAACGSSGTNGATRPQAPAAIAVDPKASLAITSEEVSFTAGGHTVPGTLVRPTAPGKRPAVVLMAGSGPTDRNWESPLLPGGNGSAKLLAEALAQRGAIVLRFDKAGVGGNQAKVDGATFDIYVEEGRAALDFLRERDEVADDKLFVAGHSEGGIHATRVALAEQQRIAGVLLLATAGRSMKEVLLAQVEAQLRPVLPQQTDAELASMRAALDDFLAGKPVDTTKASTIPQLQMLIASVVTPGTASLVRGLVGYEPIPDVTKLAVPVFVYNGVKDLQVDPELDAKPLAAARAGKPVELFIAPDADHVLKHQPKSVAELRANLLATQNAYNAADRVIDPATVDAIATWLAKR